MKLRTLLEFGHRAHVIQLAVKHARNEGNLAYYTAARRIRLPLMGTVWYPIRNLIMEQFKWGKP